MNERQISDPASCPPHNGVGDNPAAGRKDSDIRTLAAFDFDHTLITGDSFWPFLGLVAGGPQTALALLQSLAAYALGRLRNDRAKPRDSLRTFVKGQLLMRLLAGKKLGDIAPALPRLRAWQTWNEPMKKELMDHFAAGHHVVIISGALDLYLPALVEELPHHALICTKVGVANGVVTGVMTEGNCVRLRKAELLRDYIAAHGPFGTSWGYGNYPHDVPMLELLTHRVLV